MTTAVQDVLDAAQRLTPTEQLEVIAELSRLLQRQYPQARSLATPTAVGEANIPADIRRTPPATDLAQLAGDFWPQDETADEINAFIAQQRAEDRLRDA
jgi:hypothetical protein